MAEISEILRKIRKIELRTRGLVRESFGGEYHSCFKGQGIDFEDFREYQAGDEVRSIDWNVTARMGHPFVKKFVEQREMTVFLVVDASASGILGSHLQAKKELMAEVAALFAFSALQNKDKVGLILFTDEVEIYLPPRKGTGHALRIIRDILFFEPNKQGTRLTAAIDILKHAIHRRSLVILLSDFISQDDVFNSLKTVSRQHDMIAVQITDPVELDFPDVGLVCLEDSETGEQVEVDSHRGHFRQHYRAAVGAWKAELESQFRRLAIDKIDLSTDREYLPSLHAFFQRREGKRV